MTPIDRKLANAEQALARLREVLDAPRPDAIVRDSAILRFALAVETAWKAARAVIAERWGSERVGPSGPKAIVRESLAAGLLTEAQAEAAMAMMDDRNATVHTYDEATADALFARLPGHADMIQAWLEAVRGPAPRA